MSTFLVRRIKEHLCESGTTGPAVTTRDLRNLYAQNPRTQTISMFLGNLMSVPERHELWLPSHLQRLVATCTQRAQCPQQISPAQLSGCEYLKVQTSSQDRCAHPLAGTSTSLCTGGLDAIWTEVQPSCGSFPFKGGLSACFGGKYKSEGSEVPTTLA